MKSVHTHTTTAVHSAISLLGLSFAIYGKGVFSLIADYSVIKVCFKILCGEMIYHIVINVLKAFCFWGVVTLYDILNKNKLNSIIIKVGNV